MAKNQATIKFGADVADAAKGINQITQQLNVLTKSAKLSDFAKLGSAITGFGTAFKGVINGAKMAAAAIKECSDAYDTQKKAEIQLETAAKNNPYLNDSSVRALKNYASELQKISTYGDEQTIPLMARLSAAGRTQEQIMQIMSASVDMAASGTMSLDAAVTALNKTYSGNVGLLGNQISGLKTLTAEELKSGKAVAIVAENYKGMAQEVAKATGSREQLANALGDLKEEIGAPFEKGMAPLRAFFTELISGWASAKKARREYEEGVEDNSKGKGTEDTLRAEWEKVVKRQALLQKQKDKGSITQEGELELNQLNARINFLSQQIRLKEMEAKIDKERASAAEKERVEKEKQAKAEKDIADAKKRANDLATNALDAYDKAVKKAELEIEARRQLGETVTQAEENQIMYAAKKAAYENMIISAQGAISGNLEREKKTREEIAQLAAEIAAYDQSGAGLADKYAKKNQAALSWEDQKKELEDAKAAIEEWNKETISILADGTDEKIALEKKYEKAVEQINREIAEGEKQTNEERFKSFQDVFNQIGGYVTQSAQLISDAMAFQLQAVQNEKDYELAALEEKYRKGEIIEQEYNDRKVQIEKDAAQKEYKIKMWEWAANIAQATANTAMAAIGAAAQTSGNAVARIIAMSLIGAAAGVQMASLIASKPVPPSFATGGIVQGSSWSGDNVRANVNSGEMILNAAQQKALWETANGRGASGGGMSVVINNSAANVVNAQPRISRGQIEIMIDARVKEGLSSGKYNSALEQANQTMDGTFYGV